MSADLNLSGIAKLYGDSLGKSGTTARGVGWGNRPDHWLRFQKLSQVLDEMLQSESFTVNDLGCGYGALYEFLLEKGRVVDLYRGYEICEPMLREARLRLKGRNVELVEDDRVRKMAEFSFASGIFNVRFENDESTWLEHVVATLENLSELSTKGFAFNLLSTYVDYREDHLYYADPLYFFDLCKRRFGTRVALLHDYPLYEWTIAVKK